MEEVLKGEGKRPGSDNALFQKHSLPPQTGSGCPSRDSTGLQSLELTRAHCPVLLGNELPIAFPTPPQCSYLALFWGSMSQLLLFDLHTQRAARFPLLGQDLVIPYGTHDSDIHTKLPIGTTYLFPEKPKQKRKENSQV